MDKLWIFNVTNVTTIERLLHCKKAFKRKGMKTFVKKCMLH